MATREDAQLLVQLLQWGAAIGLEDALHTLFSDDFDPASASMDEPAVGRVLTFGEALGTFVKHDVLDGELVRDFLWVEGIWTRVASHVAAAREKEGEPRLYENFEALVASHAPSTAA